MYILRYVCQWINRHMDQSPNQVMGSVADGHWWFTIYVVVNKESWNLRFLYSLYHHDWLLNYAIATMDFSKKCFVVWSQMFDTFVYNFFNTIRNGLNHIRHEKFQIMYVCKVFGFGLIILKSVKQNLQLILNLNDDGWSIDVMSQPITIWSKFCLKLDGWRRETQCISSKHLPPLWFINSTWDHTRYSIYF